MKGLRARAEHAGNDDFPGTRGGSSLCRAYRPYAQPLAQPAGVNFNSRKNEFHRRRRLWFSELRGLQSLASGIHRLR